MHTIQINPNIKFIGNLEHGWQPYASVGMMWNLMNETNVKANGVDLPNMHTKPYVEYGLGVQKHMGDSFSGYAQAMVRNGGRTGIAFTAGFRWALADNIKIKVENTRNNIKTSKQEASKSKNVIQNKKEFNTINNDTDVSTVQPYYSYNNKTVIKTKKSSSKSRNLARYNALIVQ